MERQYHRVFRLELDLSLPGDEKPDPVQERVSRLLKTDLIERMGALFTEVGEPDHLIQLDRLEIDVGRIAIDEIEEEFPKALDKQLRSALLRISQPHRIQPPGSIQEGIPPLLEIFIAYLNKGYFPWWIPQDFSRDPIDLFDRSMLQHPEDLKIKMIEVIGQEWPRRRVVHQFKDLQLEQLVELLEPIHASIIIRYNNELARRQEKTAFLKADRLNFRSARWEVILKYLYEDRGSEFNQKSFLKQVLKDLAVRFNSTYAQLLQRLATIAIRLGASQQKEVSFLQNILLLAEEEQKKNRSLIYKVQTPLAQKLINQLTSEQQEAALPYLPFFEGNTKQWPTQHSNPATLLLLLQRFWKLNESKAIQLLQQLHKGHHLPDPLLEQLPEAMRLKAMPSSLKSSTQDIHPLLNGISSTEQKALAVYLPFLENEAAPWPERHPNTHTVVSFLQKLWKTAPEKAYRLLQRIALREERALPIFQQLPDTFIQQLFEQFYPKGATQYWQIRNLLLKLSNQLPITALSREELGALLDRQAFFLWSVRGESPLNFYLLLQVLIRKWADRSGYAISPFYSLLLEALVKDRNTSEIQEDLIRYSQQFIIQQYSRIQASSFTMQTIDGFPLTKEGSTTIDLPKLRSYLFDQDVQKVIPEFLKPILLDSIERILSDWTSEEQQQLMKLLYPGMAHFVIQALKDLHFLCEAWRKEEPTIRISLEVLEKQSWQILLSNATASFRKTEWLAALLEAMAKQLGRTTHEMTPTLFSIAEKRLAQLNLGEALKNEIRQASQLQMLVSPISTGKKLTSEERIYSEEKWVTRFFEEGKLPPDAVLSDIRTLAEQWSQKDPEQLRYWLRKAVVQQEVRSRLLFFFSSETTIEWMNLLIPRSGNFAMALLQMLNELPSSAKMNYQGKASKEYWQVVWEVIEERVKRGFQSRDFVLKILEQIADRKMVSQTELMRQLLELESSKSTLPISSIQFVLRSTALSSSVEQQFERQSPKEQRIGSKTNFAEMSIEALNSWLRDQLPGYRPFISFDVQRAKLVDFGKYVVRLPMKDKVALWELFSDQLVVELFEQLVSPDELSQLLDVAELVGQVEKKRERRSNRIFPIELSTLLLDAILNDRGSLSNQKAFIAKLLKDWANAHSLSYRELLETLWPLIWELGPVFRHHATLDIFSIVLEEELEPAWLARQLPQPSIADKTEEESFIQEEKPYRKLWDKDPVLLDVEGAWTIHNAGLAILWPYLNILFDRAGLMKENSFIDEEAQQKAVLLMEYLVSGNRDPAEHELVFNKVLAGYPVVAPIDVASPMTEELEALCEGLLGAAIGHWDILADTSVPAFRESFLVREGNLEQTSEYWQLKVEGKAFDVLLRQLPWGISPINLSWLEQLIKVEWA